MKVVRPGLNIKVVTDIDPLKETSRVRSSTVYDVDGDRLIIAQTAPPIADRDDEIVVTYLNDKEEDGRLGFPARITDSVTLTLAGGQQVEALVAIRKGEPHPFTMRMAYRVKPSEDNRLSLFVNDTGVRILDISLRGARFSHSRELGLEAGTTVAISVDIGSRTYSFQGRITRTWESDDLLIRRTTAFASAEFLNLSGNSERAILHKLRQMERVSIRKRLDLEAEDGGEA